MLEGFQQQAPLARQHNLQRTFDVTEELRVVTEGQYN